MHTFLKEATRKQKWTTFTRIHRLACQRNTLPCAPSILKLPVSAEVCLIGHQWISKGFTLRKVQYYQYTRSRKIHWTLITQEMRDFKRFYLEKGSVLSVYAKPKDSLDTDYPRNEGRLANQFFHEKRQYPNSPPEKENRFLFGLVGLYKIYFRSSKMTDPRPCPTGWAYF